jgi:hypothetical protein
MLEILFRSSRPLAEVEFCFYGIAILLPMEPSPRCRRAAAFCEVRDSLNLLMVNDLSSRPFWTLGCHCWPDVVASTPYGVETLMAMMIATMTISSRTPGPPATSRLSVVDGSSSNSVDRFRLKIVDESTGAVIFDNCAGNHEASNNCNH